MIISKSILILAAVTCLALVCKSCNTCTKKVNCKWGPWSSWSSCSVRCGNGGNMVRMRTVKVKASCGGAACNGDAKQSKPCSVKCPYNGKPSTGKCTCTGYSGTCCENDINECKSKICQNNGKCTNTKGSYKCECTPDFTGKVCQTQVNRCLSKPCVHGTCRDYKIGYKCICGQFYTGLRCETCLPRDCVTQRWTEWTSCTHKCGARGTRTRTRKMVVKASCGGNCETTQTEKCNQFCPPRSRLYREDCRCYKGMTGECCDIDVNECKSPKACNGNGACLNSVGSYTCKCKTGYYGRTCNLNYCKSNSCKHGGTCTAHSNGFTCKCTQFYRGDTCEIDVDECAENKKLCRYGGTCVNTDGGFDCKCTAQWSGSICQYDIDECKESPCQNGAMCKNHMHGFTCKCKSGYSGKLCDVVTDQCVLSPCVNGRCTTLTSGYECTCDDGFTGTNCDQCEPKDCVVEWSEWSRCTHKCGLKGIQVKTRTIVTPATCNGKCDGDRLMRKSCNRNCPNGASSRNGICVCNAGFTGECCKSDIDECSVGDVCGVNGICTNTVGSYTCKCKTGFYGDNCEKNHCTGMCKNGAKCTALTNGYTCECSPFYKGNRCEQDVDECLNNPCKNQGLCINTKGGFKCTCPDTYEGVFCENDIDECQSTQSCLNGGVCSNTAGGYTCTCADMYTGDRCETRIDPCQSTPCANQATCTPDPESQQGFQCSCGTGYSGSRCQITCKENDYALSCLVDNPCLSNPCENNGMCKTNSQGLMCVCPGGFYGSVCQFVLLPGCNLRAVEGEADKYKMGVHVMSCSPGTVFKASICGCGFA